MKYLGLILLVALVAGQVLAFRINENDGPLEHSRVKRGLNEKFRNFLEKLKMTLREGNETYRIPPMDPFTGNEINFVIEEKQVNGVAQLSDFQVVGLAAYTVDEAKVALLKRKITLGLTWPYIYAGGSYQFDVTFLDDNKFFGIGDFQLTLTDLSFETVVKLGISGGLSIQEMSTTISLGTLKLKATGLLGDEDTSKILSETISDMAPQLVEDYQRELTDAVNERITIFVNKKLDGKSLSDIIALLG